MGAEVGDEIIVEGTEISQAPRVGTVVSLRGAAAAPQYVVHLLAGDYDAVITPESSIHVGVRHKAHADPREH